MVHATSYRRSLPQASCTTLRRAPIFQNSLLAAISPNFQLELEMAQLVFQPGLHVDLVLEGHIIHACLPSNFVVMDFVARQGNGYVVSHALLCGRGQRFEGKLF